MEYRAFGRTGAKVSEIGLGGHREGAVANPGALECWARYFRTPQERAAVVGRTIDSGVTYFDTTHGSEIESLGESLRILNRRDGLFVSAMRVDFFDNLLKDSADVRAYTRREVEARLAESALDHFDQFMLGGLEKADPLTHERSIMDDAFDELTRLRREGKFRFLGFSCHDADYAARLLEAFPQFDSVMVPHNFYNRATDGKLADALRQTGAALIAMKPLVWHIYGVPVTVLRNFARTNGRLDCDPTVDIARMALQFILSDPLVSTIVPAMNSIQAVDENVSASGRGSLTSDEIAHLQAYADAGSADDNLLLALGGLLENDFRVRVCAIDLGKADKKLGMDIERIDRTADDAESRAAAAARELIDKARQDPRCATLLDGLADPV